MRKREGKFRESNHDFASLCSSSLYRQSQQASDFGESGKEEKMQKTGDRIRQDPIKSFDALFRLRESRREMPDWKRAKLRQHFQRLVGILQDFLGTLLASTLHVYGKEARHSTTVKRRANSRSIADRSFSQHPSIHEADCHRTLQAWEEKFEIVTGIFHRSHQAPEWYVEVFLGRDGKCCPCVMGTNVSPWLFSTPNFGCFFPQWVLPSDFEKVRREVLPHEFRPRQARPKFTQQAQTRFRISRTKVSKINKTLGPFRWRGLLYEQKAKRTAESLSISWIVKARFVTFCFQKCFAGFGHNVYENP